MDNTLGRPTLNNIVKFPDHLHRYRGLSLGYRSTVSLDLQKVRNHTFFLFFLQYIPPFFFFPLFFIFHNEKAVLAIALVSLVPADLSNTTGLATNTCSHEYSGSRWFHRIQNNTWPRQSRSSVRSTSRLHSTRHDFVSSPLSRLSLNQAELHLRHRLQ